MNSESIARLKRNLAAASDDALVALANRGLLRRAAKDLKKGPPPTVGEADDALLVRGAGWMVTMPVEGPAAATDDTSATGMTRQILQATLYLRDHWAAAHGDAFLIPGPSPRASGEQRRPAVADNGPVPEEAPAVAVDPAAKRKDAIIADRRRVARAAGRLLSAVAAAGVAHPSTRIVERFRTTAVAAEAARFPRLARLLASIADDASLQIARDVAANPARMTQRMLFAHALSTAAARPENAQRIDLFGRFRTVYSPAPQLRLHGVGAYGWRTASGFEGLTSLFWDDQGRRFLTASVSRREGRDRTFSMEKAYHGGLGWSGGAVIREMCRRQVTLTSGKVNAEGRLSTSESIAATIGEPTDPATLAFADISISDWNQLAKVAERSQPIGLRLPDPRSPLVVVHPAAWGAWWFDELDQAFVWPLVDKAGSIVEVRVPWSNVDEPGVVFLESLEVERDKATALLCRLQVRGGKMALYPLTVFSEGAVQGDKVLCPQFDQRRIRSQNESLLARLRKKFGRQKEVEARIGDAEFEEAVAGEPSAEDLRAAAPLIVSVIYDLDRILTASLEAGATSLSPRTEEALRALHERLTALGVRPLAEAIAPLLGPRLPAAAVLTAAYRLHLFRQSLRLSLLMSR